MELVVEGYQPALLDDHGPSPPLPLLSFAICLSGVEVKEVDRDILPQCRGLRMVVLSSSLSTSWGGGVDTLAYDAIWGKQP